MQIPLPPVDEKKKVVEDVDKDRRYAIDASIVRIMKSRKVMGHQQLVAECVEQLSRMFKVLIAHFLLENPTYFSPWHILHMSTTHAVYIFFCLWFCLHCFSTLMHIM